MLLTHFSETPLALVREWDYPLDDSYWRRNKPNGLWLSDETQIHRWEDYARSTFGSWGRLNYRQDFRINDMTRVIHLQNENDVIDFQTEYGHMDPGSKYFPPVGRIDWQKVREEHDGILVTPFEYFWNLEIPWYNGLDCSSGCFWNLDILEEASTPSRNLLLL